MTTTGEERSRSARIGTELLRRVPQATVTFWVIKVLTTGMGEAAADDMQDRLGQTVALGLSLAMLVGALVLQFRTRRHVASVYWLAVVAVSVLGTILADALADRLHVSLVISTSAFVVLLVGSFVAWYAVEGTLSIHSIVTARREAFYWAVVMGTFALGTAAGDLLAKLKLPGLLPTPDGTFGWFSAGVVFAVLMLLPALAHRFLGLNGIVAFWLSYVMTRPVGASFADWFASHKYGGLGFGTLRVTVGSTLLIVAFVAWLAVTRRDVVTAEAA